MKIKNLLGNEYQGSIGKSVTASTWKGRNYLKKWFKPTNPNSTLQQQVRGFMAQANVTWQGFNLEMKRAYFWYERYRKKNISPFNAMVGSFITINKADPGGYTDPDEDEIAAEDSVTTNPIEGVLCIIRKTGQATEYAREFTDAAGLTPTSLCDEDKNYDMILTKALYTPFILTDKTPAELCVSHQMVLA